MGKIGRYLLAALLFAGSAPPSQAQDVLAEYYASLSRVDMFNSRGARLTDLAAVLQQDRANFHRFGRADDGDQWDPLFADGATRARIPELYARGPGAERYIVESIRNGATRYVLVRVFGRAGVPEYLAVFEGAG